MQQQKRDDTKKHQAVPSPVTDEQLMAVMKKIVPWMNEAHPDWVIYGSAALWLNGIGSVHPRDIDILVPCPDDDGAVWNEGPLFRCLRRTKQCVESIEVDISEGLEIRWQERWIPVIVGNVVCRDGLRFASLADCQRLLRLFNRPKDRERLRRLFPE